MRSTARTIFLFLLVTTIHISASAQTPVAPKTDTPGRTDTSILKQVVVEGSRTPFQRQGDKLILNIAGNKLFRTSANAFDILRKLPGIEVSGEGALLVSGRHTPAVFINGKPVPMSDLELQNYLASLSPDLIEAIELITNPAAQYDAEHKAIINIRLKQDASLGWKGLLTTNIQQNAYTFADNNLLLTWKTKRFTLTNRLGYTNGTKIHQYRAFQHLANTNIMATDTKTPTTHHNYNYQLGADYNIQKNQHLEVLLRAYQANRNIPSVNTLHTTDSSTQQLVSDTRAQNNSAPVQNNVAANLNYSTTWKQHQFSVFSSIVKIINRQEEDIQNKNTLTGEQLYHWKTALKNDIYIRIAQADLSGNTNNGKWSIGSKMAFTTTENDIRYDTLNKQAHFETDTSRTNNFHYKEYITAGYINYEQKISKLSISIGLRVEHTHSIADAITQKQIIKRNYFTWLPGFRIIYSFNAHQQVQLSLNRRTSRPNFTQLNPFRFYLSPLNYLVGNPFLQPSTTTTLSLMWTQKAFTLSASLGREDDPMTRYPEYDSATNILQYLGRNLPYNHFANVEASVPVTITPWWRTTHNLGIYYLKEQTPYHGVTYAIPVTEVTISGSHVFSLPKGFTADLSYNYHSTGGNGLYIAPAFWNIDIGLQKTWLGGKLNTKINYYDIFRTMTTNRIFREKSIMNNRLFHYFGQQRGAVTISYSFGRSNYKARQNNKNEEETRAGL